MTLAELVRSRTQKETVTADWESAWDTEATKLKEALRGNVGARNNARTQLHSAINAAKLSRAYTEINDELQDTLDNTAAPNTITDAQVDDILGLIKATDVKPGAKAAVELVNLRELLLNNITDNKQFALPAEGTIGIGHQSWNNADSMGKLYKTAVSHILNAAKNEYDPDKKGVATEDAVASRLANYFEVINPTFKEVRNTDEFNTRLNELVAFARKHKVNEKITAGVGFGDDIIEEVEENNDDVILDKFELRLLKVFGNDPNQKGTGIVTGQDILQTAVGITTKAFLNPGLNTVTANKLASTANIGAPTSARKPVASRQSLLNADDDARDAVEKQIDNDRISLEEIFGKPIDISPVTGTNPLVVKIAKVDQTTGARQELLEYQVHLNGTQWGEVRFVTGKDANDLFVNNFDIKAKVLGFIATQTVKTSKRVGNDRRLFINVHGVKAEDLTIISFALMHSHVVPIMSTEQVQAFNRNLVVLRAKSKKTGAFGLTPSEARLLKMGEMVTSFKNEVGGDQTWKAEAIKKAADPVIPDECTINTIETALSSVLYAAYYDKYETSRNAGNFSPEAIHGFEGLLTDAHARMGHVQAKAAIDGIADTKAHYEAPKTITNVIKKPSPRQTGGGGTSSVF